MISNKNLHVVKKIKPGYFSEYLHYPTSNLIIISLDWDCLNYIRDHHGVCLLCNKNSEFYDFNFCTQKEIWVVYRKKSNKVIAMKLARTILRYKAAEVRVFPFNEELFKENEL